MFRVGQEVVCVDAFADRYIPGDDPTWIPLKENGIYTVRAVGPNDYGRPGIWLMEIVRPNGARGGEPSYHPLPPKLKFERATSKGWVPVEGFHLRDLAAAEYRDTESSSPEWAIFHVKTGMKIPGVILCDQEEAIELLRELAPIEEFSLFKMTGKNPGDVQQPTPKALGMLRMRVKTSIKAFDAKRGL